MPKKPDIRPDKGADNGGVSAPAERTALMEPMLVDETSKYRAELNDLILELAQRASGFRWSLRPGVAVPLANLVREMNCYYSNLIEGHDTHPVDIERALRDDYSDDPHKRDLQREARAHINVQAWIDAGGLTGRAVTAAGLCETHRRFCDELPEDLLWVDDPETKERVRVVGGDLRTRDVKVGRHIPASPGVLERFLARFEEAYSNLGKTSSILAAACGHHRLLWIHPFMDGNGRVARLMSHALLVEQLDSGGVWSVARGLARREAEYKQHLMAADSPRHGDLDGRGSLSEKALADFARFFLGVCLDQVTFMEGLVEPGRLERRIRAWAEDAIQRDEIQPHSDRVLEVILYRGELARGEVAGLVGVGERQARRITASLTNAGIVTSNGSRAPLHLAFPARLAPHLMPGLFPDGAFEEQDRK